MVFAGAGTLPRHPSQLYEAFFEGVFIFVVQLFLISIAKKRKWATGIIAGAFLINYALMRSIAELFREPEDGYVAFLTAGQFLSIPILIGGIVLVLKATKLLNNNSIKGELK